MFEVEQGVSTMPVKIFIKMMIPIVAEFQYRTETLAITLKMLQLIDHIATSKPALSATFEKHHTVSLTSWLCSANGCALSLFLSSVLTGFRF